MKYVGEEIEVKVTTARPIEYIRCDKCGKKILPNTINDYRNQYVHVHAWHNDWGRDSCDSHEYADYCVSCAKEVVSEYVEYINGTKELELENRFLRPEEKYYGEVSSSDGYVLASCDKC